MEAAAELQNLRQAISDVQSPASALFVGELTGLHARFALVIQSPLRFGLDSPFGGLLL